MVLLPKYIGGPGIKLLLLLNLTCADSGRLWGKLCSLILTFIPFQEIDLKQWVSYSWRLLCLTHQVALMLWHAALSYEFEN
ncbi:unnamed protein product [Prunus armeniaca]|uniref:Uncharacterized protein n=1 Tax=Prunus armeniaca TaxID=36596 RepID=A0A6J5U7D1_PRUAR|nr:unnamed protein product [Prunus armeniaca]